MTTNLEGDSTDPFRVLFYCPDFSNDCVFCNEFPQKGYKTLICKGADSLETALNSFQPEVIVIQNDSTAAFQPAAIQNLLKTLKPSLIGLFGEGVMPLEEALIKGYEAVFPITAELNSLVGAVVHFARLRRKKVAYEKELEDQSESVIHASKLATVGELSSGLFHELRGPLSVIRGYSEKLIKMFEDREVDFEEGRAVSEKIFKMSERIHKMANTVRRISRDSTLDPVQPIRLSDLFEDVSVLVEGKLAKNDVDLFIPWSAKDYQILARPVEADQVFVNLISNAIDAIKDCEERWIRVQINEEDEQIQIVVSDSGPGIPYSIRSKIFEPFFTTKKSSEGTGLGLSVSRKIVASMGGNLILDPSRQETAFCVTLPRVRSSEQ